MTQKSELSTPPDQKIPWTVTAIFENGAWVAPPAMVGAFRIMKRTWFRARDEALVLLAGAGYYFDRDTVRIAPLKA